MVQCLFRGCEFESSAGLFALIDIACSIVGTTSNRNNHAALCDQLCSSVVKVAGSDLEDLGSSLRPGSDLFCLV